MADLFSNGSYVIDIDNDNNATTESLRITKDAESVDLLTVSENGDVSAANFVEGGVALASKYLATTAGAVGTTNLADSSVSTAKLANLAVTAGKIANATITATQLANNAVGTSQINNLAVTAAKIANSTITAAQIANATITQAKMANASIGTDQIMDANIIQSKMDNESVGTPQIIDLNVTTEKIADAAITQLKMADTSIGTAQIIDANIITSKIANGSITPEKLDRQYIEPSDLVLSEYKKMSFKLPGTVDGELNGKYWLLDTLNNSYYVWYTDPTAIQYQAAVPEKTTVKFRSNAHAEPGEYIKFSTPTETIMFVSRVKTFRKSGTHDYNCEYTFVSESIGTFNELDHPGCTFVYIDTPIYECVNYSYRVDTGHWEYQRLLWWTLHRYWVNTSYYTTPVNATYKNNYCASFFAGINAWNYANNKFKINCTQIFINPYYDIYYTFENIVGGAVTDATETILENTDIFQILQGVNEVPSGNTVTILDPAIPGKTGVNVLLSNADSANKVAAKTESAISALTDVKAFVNVLDNTLLQIEALDYGNDLTIADSTFGITNITTLQDGVDNMGFRVTGVDFEVSTDSGVINLKSPQKIVANCPIEMQGARIPKITVSDSLPTGGTDGDIWFKVV